MGDVFDGRNLCIVDSGSTDNYGDGDEPPSWMVLMKEGVRLSPSGLDCDNAGAVKIMTFGGNDDMPPSSAKRPSAHLIEDEEIREEGGRISPELFADGGLRGEDSESEEAPTCVWGDSGDPESISDGRDAPTGREMRNYFIDKENGRKEETQLMAGRIDSRRYVAYTISRLYQVTVRWRVGEKRTRRKSYTMSVRSLKEIPGAKTMRRSRTSKMSK